MKYTNIYASLLAELDNIPVKPAIIIEENTTYERTIGRTSNGTDSYWRLLFRPTQTEPTTIGVDGIERDIGTLRIEVCTAITKGGNEANIYADSIRKRFQKGKQLVYSGQTINIIRTWRETGYQTSKWFITPVYVQWECFSQTVRAVDVLTKAITITTFNVTV